VSGREMPRTLERFRIAQDRGGTYERAVAELRSGRKRSHWMWFVFPQLRGLGHSAMSRTYSICSLAEARDYLRDPVLGPRLLECARILTELGGASADEIFGPVDALRLRSSMTLFARAAPESALFALVLDMYFGGVADAATEELLERAGR
jgi:uncharacterized protein (DUF1810 family)